MDDTTGRIAADPITDPSLPADVEVRAVEIRAEIADTRGEISETIDAIQERLTPAHLAQQAKDAATGKVKQMANRAGNKADLILPISLIGVGTAWLLSKRRSHDWNDDDRWAYDRETGYGRRAAYGDYEAVGTRGTFGNSRGTYENSSGTMENLTSQARETADEVRDAARRTTRKAQVQFQDVLDNNPLMLGAAAALIGAVVGMSMPSTDVENEWMGEARDAVVDQAKDMASNLTDNAKGVASKLTGPNA
jgi:ElaB/YqjD/DUF883 family membrane-anchored ribosome-binding protein